MDDSASVASVTTRFPSGAALRISVTHRSSFGCLQLTPHHCNKPMPCHCIISLSHFSPTAHTTAEPNNSWTIEELMYWSLSQYHSKAISQTASHIQSLSDNCDRECDDLMELHRAAVELAENGTRGNGGDNEENVRNHADAAAAAVDVNAKITNNNNSSTTTTKTLSPGTITVLITSGPHNASKFTLRPKPCTPCFIGRSKGKKFIKNGISLSKDQEVSTTHGKILVEGGGGGGLSASGAAVNGSNSDGGSGAKFYFIDVGSTNGTTLNGELIEPETKILLTEGLELKAGGSNLKFMLG
eukprot:scaffold804_cov211-Alexandrium_tamarense.AAC.4